MNRKSSIVNPWGWLPEELEIIEPRTAPSIVDWAPKHLTLPAKESPKLAGPFSFEYSPYLIEPCEWFCDPYVREITLKACLQGGKTLYTLVCVSWLIEFSPGPTMIVMTDENTLHRRTRRLRATFQSNPYLMRQLKGKIDNLHIGEPTDLEQMMLLLAWSNSAAMMADVPVKYIFADEVSLWQPTVGVTEVDAVSHLRGRQLTFEDQRKLVKISSPENVGDLFDTEYEDGDRCEYWVGCAGCSHWHVMRWYDKDNPGVYAVLDREKDGAWLRPRDYETGRHVRYICPSCGRVWSDYARAEAVRKGRWLPAGVTMGIGGKVEGTIEPAAYKSAHISGLMVHPRLRSLGQMGAEWVRADIAMRTGNKGKLKRFLNAHLGQSWKEERAVPDEAQLRKHISSYKTGTAPWGVQAVTIAIDVHDNWFRYAVVGWGYLRQGWPIDIGRIETSDTRELSAFEPLRPLIAQTWPLEDGMWLPVSAVGIDCGYRTDVVKDFCRANRHLIHNGNVIPVRGSSHRMNRSYSKVPQDSVLNVYELNTLDYKDQAWRMLFETEEPGGGYMHLPADVKGDVISELCSEHKIIKAGRPIWVPKADGRDNHSWDVTYMSLFLAYVVGVGHMRPLPAEPVPSTPPGAKAIEPSKPIRKIRTHYD
jgi:phage terminase large subunit GpA-like protein